MLNITRWKYRIWRFKWVWTRVAGFEFGTAAFCWTWNCRTKWHVQQSVKCWDEATSSRVGSDIERSRNCMWVRSQRNEGPLYFWCSGNSWQIIFRCLLRVPCKLVCFGKGNRDEKIKCMLELCLIIIVVNSIVTKYKL